MCFPGDTSCSAKSQKPSRAREMRTRARVNFNREMCALVIGPNMQLVQVTSTDLSTGGMGFTCPVAFRLGDQVVMVFLRDGMSNLYLCKVRNVRWMKSLCYRVGVEFTQSQRQYTGQESIPLAWFGLLVEAAGFGITKDGLLQKPG